MNSLALICLFTCTSDKGFVVYNTPSESNIILPDNGVEVFEGYPVDFQAVLSDANHQVDQLTTGWVI